MNPERGSDERRLSYRHALIREVVEDCRQAKAPQVELFVFPSRSRWVTSARGFISGDEEPPRFVPGASSGTPLTPDEAQAVARLQPVHELRLGEYLHLAARSACAGFLHLFNFGTSGYPRRLFPASPEAARRIAEGQTFFITPNRQLSPFMPAREPFRELGDSEQAGQLGRLNGRPEGLFALVLARNREVRLADLHPDWQVFDAPPPPVSAPPGESGEPRGLSFGEDGWGWGYLEVPVVEAAP